MTGVADEQPTGAWTPALESDTLRERAHALDAEAGRLDAEAARLQSAAKDRRGEAAQARAKADRLDSPERGVPAPQPPIVRARRDGLMAAASVAVESLLPGFSARDLAAALGIADVGRATRLLLALAAFGKVSEAGDGWAVNDPDEARVRDYALAAETFTLADVIAEVQLSEMDASYYVGRLRDRGVIDGAGGHFRVVPVPPHSEPRPRRRPPEKDPPAGHDAPAGRGEPVRIVDHGKRSKATTRHREKLRDKRHDAMQTARQEAAERRRNRESKEQARRKKKK